MSRPRPSVPSRCAGDDPRRIWLVSTALAWVDHSTGANAASRNTTTSSAAAVAPTGVRRARPQVERRLARTGQLSRIVDRGSINARAMSTVRLTRSTPTP
jgi:hypothetical protein